MASRRHGGQGGTDPHGGYTLRACTPLHTAIRAGSSSTSSRGRSSPRWKERSRENTKRGRHGTKRVITCTWTSVTTAQMLGRRSRSFTSPNRVSRCCCSRSNATQKLWMSEPARGGVPRVGTPVLDGGQCRGLGRPGAVGGRFLRGAGSSVLEAQLAVGPGRAEHGHPAQGDQGDLERRIRGSSRLGFVGALSIHPGGHRRGHHVGSTLVEASPGAAGSCGAARGPGALHSSDGSFGDAQVTLPANQGVTYRRHG